jgi:hypothetical protein
MWRLSALSNSSRNAAELTVSTPKFDVSEPSSGTFVNWYPTGGVRVLRVMLAMNPGISCAVDMDVVSTELGSWRKLSHITVLTSGG